MNQNTNQTKFRFTLFKLTIILVGFSIVFRLFQIQVLQHSFYRVQADSAHIKKYELEPVRGEIFALDGSQQVPLVINQTQKKLIADPRFIDDTSDTAKQLASITGADEAEYRLQLEKDTAYVELEKAISLEDGKRVGELELKGIALRDTSLRIYPENNLAAHVLGFVNGEGQGQYGVEQFLDSELAGKKGLLSGTFDVRGVPVAVADNTEIQPVNGADITLSIDRSIQRKVEQLLQSGLEAGKSESGSVVVMDPNTGKVKALANFPTYEPAQYSQTEDISYFTNAVISSPYEPGSVVKAFTMAHGLQSGAVLPSTTYFDPGFEVIDGFKVRNAGALIPKTRTMTEVITKSVNTGVINVLKNLNGNNIIDIDDKKSLHGFFTGQLGFGQKTNIELAGESAGVISAPEESSDVKYANMTFGQGVSMNMIHLASGLSSLINGGNYYQPSILQSYTYPSGKVEEVKPTIIRSDVISDVTSQQIKTMLKTVVDDGGGYLAKNYGYNVGGKTGTAQLANPEGGYFEDQDTGSFFGYGASDEQQYVIVVRVNNPRIGGYAGSRAAAPIFANISDWLISYYGIEPQEGVN